MYRPPGSLSGVEVVANECERRRRQKDHRARVDAVDPRRFGAVAPQEEVHDLSVDLTGQAQHPPAGGVEQADDAARR